MSYTATGYYLDPNGRRGDFLVESPSTSRSQIERIVRNRYDADKVIINSVGPTVSAADERHQRDRAERDRSNQQQAVQDLKDRYSSSSSSSSSYSTSSGGNNQLGFGGFVVLLGLVIIGGVFGGTDEDTAPVEEPSAPVEAPAPAPVAPAAPAPVYVPNRTSRPVYARTEPSVKPVWEMDEDLTGNPDFTFND